MKFGVDVVYKNKLSNKWDFRENRLGENSTVIQSANYCMSALPAIFRPP